MSQIFSKIQIKISTCWSAAGNDPNIWNQTPEAGPLILNLINYIWAIFMNFWRPANGRPAPGVWFPAWRIHMRWHIFCKPARWLEDLYLLTLRWNVPSYELVRWQKSCQKWQEWQNFWMEGQVRHGQDSLNFFYHLLYHHYIRLH